MRRAFAAILAVWSTLAIVAVLAWSHPPTPVTAAAAQGVPMTLVIQGKNGSHQLAHVVVLPAGTQSVASTHSSTTTGTSVSRTASGGVFLPASSVQPVAHTSSS
jgi:hypothetical protein